ncbi:MFS transporter [Pelagicoccus sp. NFK12]|uniref:MFS transporter n=1 Tax=Pelagicoccus enzymogenes TaxID=2773457 RepID=A0A927F6Y0_9BACT|nr:MFS transporter [Pelagicoccus enzymogenes]MBD5778098.1 MFS transporter [Pelagicoccus enzymogenes]MDQ8198146.1 MFS transporter [Pelagicoccus enzymogenes]
MSNVNPSKLFTASCLALIVTAMTFAIRAGILSELATDFGLSDTQLGWVNSMAFLGFPVAMMILGLAYNYLGARNLMIIAFVGHLAGLLLTIYAGGFWSLLISTFLIGFANGSVEAACNPLIADMYPKNQTTMLNRFHVWFPGGIVIGALASKFMTDASLGWQLQIAIMLVPTIIYGIYVFTQAFPASENIETNTGTNIKSLFSPLYIFMILCMFMTAISEFGPQQWVGRLLSESGASPMIILALGTGLMALGRQFAGPIVHKLNPIGVLLLSSIITCLGIYLLSTATGSVIYLATAVFALGVCYYWPTMIGFIGEYQPKTGALGMSLMGGAGMFSVSVWNPIIGSWIDTARAEATAAGIPAEEIELAAGQATLGNMMLFPGILIVAFAILFALRGKVQKAAVV